jgi:hypothetical protein
MAAKSTTLNDSDLPTRSIVLSGHARSLAPIVRPWPRHVPFISTLLGPDTFVMEDQSRFANRFGCPRNLGWLPIDFGLQIRGFVLVPSDDKLLGRVGSTGCKPTSQASLTDAANSYAHPPVRLGPSSGWEGMSLGPYYVVKDIIVHFRRFHGAKSLLLQHPPGAFGYPYFCPYQR